jgi:uncharacterized membrane protein
MPGTEMAKSQGQANAAAYGREALSEWTDALRYGSRAIAARLREGTDTSGLTSLRQRLNPAETEKGGRVGDAADAVLARLGTPGKLASKVSLGSRIVDRVGGGMGNGAGGDASPEEDGAPPEAGAAVPIQESIDVAVPLGGVFELCSQFLDFPDYLDRVVEVEEADKSRFVFFVRVGRRLREIEVEIVEERPDERIEWECEEELAHAGVLTFHPLAPRLTRLELTIERQPEGFSERLARQIHLPGRAIEAELHRFKAHAELLDEDFEDYVPDDLVEDEVDEEPDEEEPDEEEPDEEEEPVEEEPAEEDELEPA